jgi:putative endonuclease
MREEKYYYIYMLASSSRRALYTGVTSSLARRVQQHREGLGGFTSKYKAFRLVHYEQFMDVRSAIAREKQIKGWTREKKNMLVLQNNPPWRDLGVDLGLEAWPAADRKILRR